MLRLADISEGCLITHLRFLLDQACGGPAGSRRDAAGVADLLNNDPVFREISAGLRLPFGSAPRAAELLDQAEEVKQRLPALAASHWDKILRFLNPQVTEWRDTDYLILPVTSEGNPALLYLRAEQTRNWVPHVDDGITGFLSNYDGLRTYFRVLVPIVLEQLYRVDRYPFAADREFSNFVTRFAFDQRVTEGRSGGAAVLAMLAIVYLRKCNIHTRGKDLIGPLNGTVLIGEVAIDGRILPVDHLAAKVAFVHREYGRGLKMILPDGEKLSAELSAAVGSENVVYVDSVEQLLANVLANGRDARGLAPARREIFRLMSPAELDLVCHNLREDAVLENIAAEGELPTPIEHENSIFTLCVASGDSLKLSIGCSEFSVLEPAEAPQQRLLLLILVDGSYAMNSWWVVDPETGVSRMASILAFIAGQLDVESEDVHVGFLSHTHLEPVRVGATASELHSRLSGLRASFGLESKGAFLRPARWAYERMYAGRRKRVFVLSDQLVADYSDVTDSEVEHHEQLRFSPPSGRALVRDDKTLNLDLLQACFARRSDSLPSLSLELGLAMPVRWSPASGSVSYSEGRFQLRWEEPGATSWRVQMLLNGLTPHQLRAQGTCIRHGASQAFAAKIQPAIRTHEPSKSLAAGLLDDQDFALWLNLESKDRACPQCGKTDLHLFHDPSNRVLARLAFVGLQHLKGGWLALTAGKRDWELFDTGCFCAGDRTAVALVNQALHYLDHSGALLPVIPSPAGRGIYSLQVGDNRHHFAYLP